MSADIEMIDGMGQAMFERVAWHHLGEVAGQNFGWAEMVASDLTITHNVEKVAIGDLVIGYECQADEYAAVRKNADGSKVKVLATGLGEQWTPFQAVEGYEFGQCVRAEAEEVLGVEADLRSGGCIDQGRKWFMTFDLGEFSIGDYKVRDYVSVNGSWDSSWKLQLLTSPVIEVCANTIAAARAAGIVHYSFKHTSGIRDRVNEAKRALARHAQNRQAFATLGEALLATPVPAKTYGQMVEALFPIAEDAQTKAKNAAELGIEEVTKLYKGLNPGQNFVQEAGNAWSFVQAVNTYENWVKPIRITKGRDEATTRALHQVESVVSGKQVLTDKAFELVGALVN